MMPINLDDKKIYMPIVIILLAVFFSALLYESSRKSITVDEISHIPSGYSKIKTGDFRLNLEAAPLVDMLSSLPLLLINPKLPIEHKSWSLAKDNEFEGQYHWDFGEEFFYNSGNDPDTILHYARIPIMLLSVLLGIVIFLFSKKLFGAKAALFSLVLYVFNPTIIAHSSLATIDIGSAFFSFLAVYFFWKFINDISLRNIILAGITFGAAQLSKFTAIYLFPVYVILAIIIIYKKRNPEVPLGKSVTSRKAMLFYGLVALIFVIGMLTIILGYFVVGFPKYIDGMKYVLFHTDTGHPSYLMGEHSRSGWWYYYLVAFLIKEPVPLLILILLSIVFFKGIRHQNSINEFFIIVPIAVLVLISMFTKINIGIRHLLPIYPFLFIFVGRIVNLKFHIQKIFFLTLILLSIWYISESVQIYPNDLAYFNEIIGGPKNGAGFLLDSNIDWGQDLKGLKAYLDEKSIQNIRMGYWGKDRASYRGINYTQVNCYPETGLVAVSVNYLYGISEENSQCLSWLMKYKPISNIGHSILIFDINEDIDTLKAGDKFCEDNCIDFCNVNAVRYFKSEFVNGSCECECEK